ncbi:MAG: hypothetical protein B6D64_14595 [Bacteroidetes bacterium 4484_276]|nr:MAG: hypothetical protein B6D64_14595 [Bacteroidetes bacterium 4484_276]
MSKRFNTVGTITKKETLVSIEHDTDKALVLETLRPYPGYHGTTIPDQLNPRSLFLVTNKKYTGERMIRATMAIKKGYELPFDAAPGQISLFNELTPCIRIKDMKQYGQIDELVKLYRANGIGFMKDKKIPSFSGLISIRKYFSLQPVEDKIYHDLEMPPMAYLEIPALISWDEFEGITKTIKQNMKVHNNFDAALGVLFTPAEIIDIVRIYDEDIDVEEEKLIREKYLEEIARLQ